eukprot:gene43573-54127_t
MDMRPEASPYYVSAEQLNAWQSSGMSFDEIYNTYRNTERRKMIGDADA